MNLSKQKWTRRHLLMTALTLTGVAAALPLLSACGGSGGANGEGGATTSAPPNTGSETEAAQLEIGVDGNNMAFDKTTLQARAGQAVSLTFTNDSTGLQHNWVLVNGGDDVAAQVAEAGLAAGPDGGYLPADTADILAATELLDAGATDTVTFAAPTGPGDYAYLCTLPGHYQAGMKGIFTVTA